LKEKGQEPVPQEIQGFEAQGGDQRDESLRRVRLLQQELLPLHMPDGDASATIATTTYCNNDYTKRHL
jgi:hypothetical protein